MTNTPNSSVSPTLVVITGSPGSGKSTLAHQLAGRIRCPLISRDELKEGFIHTIRQQEKQPENLNQLASKTYFDTLTLLLTNQITLLTEAAFQHKVWSAQLPPLQAIAHLKIICCVVDVELAKTRFIERSINDPDRAQFHDDLTGQLQIDVSQTLIGQYKAPQLDIPTLKVDTSDGYDPSLDKIISFIGL